MLTSQRLIFLGRPMTDIPDFFFFFFFLVRWGGGGVGYAFSSSDTLFGQF